MEITAGREGIARVGEWVRHKKKMRKVIGYAVGEDGRDCYVSCAADDDYGWRTHLTPIDEVERKFVEVERKFVEVPIDSDTAALEHCDGCVGLKDKAWRCYDCARKQRNDMFKGETSDGFHTFNELYHHRAILFSKVVSALKQKAWKSKKHADGSMFDGGWFIVGIETPDGQATYHYEIEPYWEMFDCKELEFAPAWDGHTPKDAIERISKLALDTRAERTAKLLESNGIYGCGACGSVIYTFFKPSYCPSCGAKVVSE